MAYTEIPTYTTNQLITATHANTYWRDNINQLWPFDAAGDIAYATAADALTNLALGTEGQFLRAGAAAPAWYANPSFIATDVLNDVATTNSTSYINTAINITVAVPVVSTVIAVCHLSSYPYPSGSGGQIWFRWLIDGTGMTPTLNSGALQGYVPGCVLGYKANVAAGSRTFVVQTITSSGSIYSRYGYMNAIVIGFPE